MNKVIWVIEDDFTMSYAIQLLLQESNYIVKLIHNKKEYENALENLPDLILLDLKLIDLDGKQVCTELKENKKTAHIPVIIMSGGENINLIATEYNANDYIPKPFDIAVIENKIKLLLEK